MDPAISSEPAGSGASGTGGKTTGAYVWEYQSVVTSVGPVTAYDDLDGPEVMRADAAEVGRNLPPPEVAPSFFLLDYQRDLPKREIKISKAAQRIANALHLHLD